MHKLTHVNHLLYWLEKSGSDARQQMCAGLTNREGERGRDRGREDSGNADPQRKSYSLITNGMSSVVSAYD